MFFVVERRTGPKCDPSQPLEGQSGWLEHAAFMDALVDDGVVVLCGPLANESRVVLVVEVASEDEARAILGRDPWSWHAPRPRVGHPPRRPSPLTNTWTRRRSVSRLVFRSPYLCSSRPPSRERQRLPRHRNRAGGIGSCRVSPDG